MAILISDPARGKQIAHMIRNRPQQARIRRALGKRKDAPSTQQIVTLAAMILALRIPFPGPRLDVAFTTRDAFPVRILLELRPLDVLLALPLRSGA